jgi:hypothetical protein
MKLIDMYFWQVGFTMDNPAKYSENELQAISFFAKSNIQTPSIKNQRIIMNKGKTEEIRQYITNALQDALLDEESYCDLISGEIHNEMNLSNRMPSVCNAMTSIDNVRHEIIHDTPSGKSSTKKVRYWLK